MAKAYIQGAYGGCRPLLNCLFHCLEYNGCYPMWLENNCGVDNRPIRHVIAYRVEYSLGLGALLKAANLDRIDLKQFRPSFQASICLIKHNRRSTKVHNRFLSSPELQKTSTMQKESILLNTPMLHFDGYVTWPQ